MPYLEALLAFITHHPALAYGTIFLVSLCESLALVGLVIPGTVIMFGIGAVVATGSLGLKPVLLLAMAGAIAGDGVSYWLGHHYRERLQRIWPFSRYPGMLQKGMAFFNRHGGKSILFGRFVGPVRPVIPVVAGMLGMRPLHFSVVNVLSALGWALVYILPGVFFRNLAGRGRRGQHPPGRAGFGDHRRHLDLCLAQPQAGAAGRPDRADLVCRSERLAHRGHG